MNHLPETEMHATRPATQCEIDEQPLWVKEKLAHGWKMRVQITDDEFPELWLVEPD